MFYIEDNINKMFKEGGKLIDSKKISREDLLEILDGIPQSLINTLSGVSGKKRFKAVQTDESGGANTASTSTLKPAGSKRGSTIRLPSINPLARAINKLAANKKEKVSPMPDGNAFKLIESILDERINVDLDNTLNNK